MVLLTSTLFTFLVSSARTFTPGHAVFPFSVPVFLLSSSLLKLSATRLLLWFSPSPAPAPPPDPSSPGSLRGLLLASPYLSSAVLYSINDALVFVVMAYFDAVSYSVLVTTKIFVVALLTRWVLRRRLTDVQYASFVVLFAGVFVNQYEFCQGGAAGQGQEAPHSAGARGYVVVALAEVVGACAGILNEFVMKLKPAESVHSQNAKLYACSCCVWAVVVLVKDWRSLLAGTFGAGLGSYASLFLLAVNAARGISISFVYKENTNMTKVFIISVGTLAQGVLAWLFADFRFTTQFALAVVIISSALYLYASQKSDDISADGLYGVVDDEVLEIETELDRMAKETSKAQLN